MTIGEVRQFRRADRDQLTSLVNAHVQAVVPGISVSGTAVLNQLEREPGEFIVDPWVAERATLVVEQRGRVSAAAHLIRYGTGTDVGPALRGTGEIRWLIHWPGGNLATALRVRPGRRAPRCGRAGARCRRT